MFIINDSHASVNPAFLSDYAGGYVSNLIPTSVWFFFHLTVQPYFLLLMRFPSLYHYV